MGAYILRRLMLIIPTLIGIMVINFALTQFVPGGPIEQVLARLRDRAQAPRRRRETRPPTAPTPACPSQDRSPN